MRPILPTFAALLFGPIRALLAAHQRLRLSTREHVLARMRRDERGAWRPVTSTLPLPGGDGTPPRVLEVPLLVLDRIPAPGIRRAAVEFHLEWGHTSEAPAAGGGGARGGLRLHGRVAATRERRRPSRPDPTCRIRLELAKVEPPEGVNRLHDRLVRKVPARRP